MKALIIDDEIDICLVLSNILKKHNIESKFVTNLADAKKILSIFYPAIVYLDNHLPDGMGVNFIKELRQQFPQTYIIMISAYDNAEDKSIALKNGANLFLSKPFSMESINKNLNELIQARNTQNGNNYSQ